MGLRKQGQTHFEGAVTVVTGGGSGLGAALVRRLANQGASLVIVDLRPDRVKQIIAEIGARGHSAFGWACDVADTDAVQKLFREVRDHFDRVDLLINCAGRSMLRSFLDMTDDDLKWVLGPNLYGVVNCIRAAVPMMPPGSRIVNVTSVSGRVPTPGEAYYSALKAAIVSLSESLNAELEGRGIGVTVVLPGEMSTALFDEHPSWERRPTFQRRMEIDPDPVARAILSGVRKGRFEVVRPRYMRAVFAVQRIARTPFRLGVARYWRKLEPLITEEE